MNFPLRKCILLALCLLALFGLALQVNAQDAADLTSELTISGTGYTSFAFLQDGNTERYRTASGNAQITLEHPEGMAGLYLLFFPEYGEYTITDNDTGAAITAGQHNYLHEWVDLSAAFGKNPTSVTLNFSNGAVRLCEISAFSGGDLPSHVQVWEPPLEGGADLVLFSAHGDDEQLYFAGLLPYYAGELGYRVQVVYMTDHRKDTELRVHEMLNGLWNVGVTAYPVFGPFDDFRIDDLAQTYAAYRQKYHTPEEDLIAYVVENIRRFKPLVAVGHDLKGEYGHGMHLVYSDLLIRSLPITGDATQFPESAQRYGTWEIPKLYLHLYPENPIIMDYDQPLSAFGGMTAFQVTQELGFPCHVTQQNPMFVRWLYGRSGPITKASEIATYSPCEFGLYHSTVGADVQKNDFFENLLTYGQMEEQARLEQERLEQERLEQERLEQERLEQERLEQERLEQERLEQERLEQERLEQERLEQERLEQERLKQQQQAAAKHKKQLILLICGGLLVFAVGTAALIYFWRKR